MSEATVPTPQTDLSDFQRLMIITALSISVFTVGISLGGIIPWIALKQDMLGADGFTIGLIVAAQPLGIMLVAPLVSRVASSRGLGMATVVFSNGTLPGGAPCPGFFTLALLRPPLERMVSHSFELARRPSHPSKISLLAPRPVPHL